MRLARLFLVSALSLPAAQAQQATIDPPGAEIKTLPKRFVADEWQMWTSPFRAGQRGHTLTKYVIPFAAASAALIATDQKTADLWPNTSDQTKWSGRVSQFGASYTLAGISGGTYLLGRFSRNDHLRETGLLGLEALGHAQLAVFVIKEITNRERPIDNDGGRSFWRGGTSFPSGHAASSFAVATVFAYEYRDHIAVPITAYSLAGLVSISRLGARRHWVSDVAVGSALGFLVGRFTYKRNHDPSLPGSKIQSMVPQVGIGGGQFVLSWRL
jgi:hypothetical protein